MFARWLFALAAPLILTGCLLTPGKFASTLSINADRSFAFTYKGEVIAIDPSSAMRDLQSADKSGKPAAKPDKEAEAAADKRNREIAAALAKEEGYRSVAYLGKGKFAIDYAVSGRLTHNLLFPFNTDAEAVFPFVAVELRKDGLVRVKAPGFASQKGDMIGGTSGAEAAKFLDGSFTLDTDAEIVSQNNEEGAKVVGGRKLVTWRATPLSKDAPAAVVRISSAQP